MTVSSIPNVDPGLEEAIAEYAISHTSDFVGLGVGVDDLVTRMPRLVVGAVEKMLAEGQAVSRTAVIGALGLYSGQAVAPSEDLERILDLDMALLRRAPDALLLKRLRRMRELRESLLRAASLAEKGDASAVLASLANVDVGEYTNSDVMNAGQLAERAIERFAAPVEQRIGLGLARLSSAVGYMPAGGVMVVAGGTGVGKSSCVLELLIAAARAGTSAGMISLEDSEEIAGGRLLSMESGVSARLLQRGIADSSGWHHVNQAYASAQRISDSFLFSNCIGGTEIDVCAAMSRMARRGAKLIAVDYIGEIQSSAGQQDRRNEIRWMMTRLKQHALRLGVALIVVSQLSRPPKQMKFWKPSKHDLKECGDLENKAEVVLLLWREEESDFAPVHVEVAKCKWGGTGQRWTMQREQAGGSARLVECA